MPPIKSYVWNHSKPAFEKLVKESVNWSDLARKCGYNCTTNSRTLKKRIAKDKLDASHLDNWISPPPTKIAKPLEEVCVENSTYATRHLKNRLFKELNWAHKCSYCHNTEWKSLMDDGEMMPIPLELDHINGSNKDHRLENLRLLCPNCHATTDTFKGRNVKRTKKENKCIDCDKIIYKTATRCQSCSSNARNKVKDRPRLEQLEQDKESMSMVAVGKKYGVSHNAIRKWIKQYKKI
jgi:5-methylcytosine-specific restriction endonuclease McrA